MRLVLAAAAACLLLAQPAAAGTVSMRFEPGGRYSSDANVVAFAGSGTEVNGLDARIAGSEYRLTDTVPLQAGEGCEQVTAVEAVCRVSYRGRLVANLGDGDDRATLSGGPGVLVGGAGDDTLIGGPLPDTLVGGTGADTLQGGDGDDTFPAGEAAPGETPDRMQGGPGRDIVSFGGSDVPVTADLATGRGRLGTAKELIFEEIEGILGSARDDRLLGGPGDDRLYGFNGDDVVDGRAGDDTVTGGSDRDVVRGGPGDDQLEVDAEAEPLAGEDSTGRNRIDCGPGADSVEVLYHRDTVTSDCEQVGELRLLADLRRPARAHLRLPGVDCEGRLRCRERLTLRTRRGTLLLRRDYAGREPRRSRARPVRVGRAARATLRRERARRVHVRFGDPRNSPTRFTIALP